MAVAKITKTEVEKLRSGCLWDSVVQGFGCRKQKDGTFYYVRYRLNGVQRMRSIGRHGPLTPDTARAQAKAKLGKAAVGIDPFPPATAAAETLGSEVERYLAKRKLKLRPRTFVEVQRHLTKDAKPLHSTKLNEIDRRMIAVLLGQIETASGPNARKTVRASLSAFFSRSIKEGLIETNPVAGTDKGDAGGPRERLLMPTELAAIWHGLREDRFSDIVRLLILTAQRRNEIGGLRLSEIDFDRGLICLPPTRTKNKRSHEVPMSAQVRSIIQRRISSVSSSNGSSDNVGNAHTANSDRMANDVGLFGLFCGWHECKVALDKRVKLAKPWRLHDLRRTAATMMADKLGVFPHIIEAILNHVSGHKSGVAGVYNLAKYENEMREALVRWGEYIDGGN
jgi:integrase